MFKIQNNSYEILFLSLIPMKMQNLAWLLLQPIGLQYLPFLSANCIVDLYVLDKHVLKNNIILLNSFFLFQNTKCFTFILRKIRINGNINSRGIQWWIRGCSPSSLSLSLNSSYWVSFIKTLNTHYYYYYQSHHSMK